ncbi:MAG TPA: hypothetical protein VF331_02130 [Polyangiales bacterium]
MNTQASATPAVTAHTRWLALLLCAFAYLYVFPYQATLNNPNENVRFYMTAALAELGHYQIDELRARWGWVNDAAVHGGHVWSVKAPGTSFFGVPGYFLYLHGSRLLGHGFDRTEALWVCRVTGSVLPTLLFGFVFFGWLARRTRHAFARETTFFSVMLGSLIYAYALMFTSHTLSAAVAFSAFMWLYDVRHGEAAATTQGALLAGLLTGGATFFEYPGLAGSLPLALYGALVLRKPKLVLAFALGGALPALVMMHFQWRAFGNPFTPGHLFVENDSFRAAHEQGLYGAVGPSAAALYGLLLDPGAGLLPLTPLLALSVPGLWILLRDRERRLDAVALIAIVVLTVVAIASMNNWRGGWTVGARYLALCIPFLAWPTLVALDAWAERSVRTAAAVALGCTAVGLVASGIASAYYPHLPPEVSRPLPQIFAVLIEHGYAPANAGAWLGLFGNASMLPLLMAAVLVLWLCLRTLATRARAGVLAGGALLAVLLILPLWLRPSSEPGVRQALAFITRRFWPEGHDQTARLHAELKAQAQPAHEALERLAQLYREEGRDTEAQAALQGRL